MLAPHLEIGGADKFNLDLIECLQRDHAYEVSIITTRSSPHRWREQFERLTPDVFILHALLPVEDYPQFISNFIQTNKPNTVRPRRNPHFLRRAWGGGAGCCPRVRMVYCDGNLFP